MQRRYWMMEYNQAWFEKMWDNRNDEIFLELWSKEFRVRPQTFEFIVNLVVGSMGKRNTNFRNAIQIQKRVAVAIWRLSTGNSYRTVSKVFGIAKSTVVKIVHDFCSELCSISHQFIKFPNNAIETASEIQSFKVMTGCVIPQVLGAIDGTHIEILSPECDSKVDYYSRKQKYTINTQAVVGGNLMFFDVATGFPGSIHDARVLRATSLFQKAEQGVILSSPVDVILNQRVRPLLIGDGAYPSTSWQIKPYPITVNLTEAEKKFNKKLSSARSCVERAFGTLKGRWRCLLKRLDNRLENVSQVVITCCVLHNICQRHGDQYVDDDEILDLVIAHERRVRQKRAARQPACRDGDELRELLTEYINI